MRPNEVDSHNEQHLLDTVYNYKRKMTTSEMGTPATTVRAANQQRRRRRATTAAQVASRGRRQSKFKLNQHVRISKYRYVFYKSYTPNWTHEIFQIRKVQYHTDPITYLLRDYRKVDIAGSFYPEELQAVKYPGVYLYEDIIKRRNGKVLVKWRGFGPEHNTWEFEKDLV